MEEMRNEFKFLGVFRRWKEDNTKMNLTEIGCEVFRWRRLARDTVQQKVVVNMAISSGRWHTPGNFVGCNVRVIKLKTLCKVIGAHGVNKSRIQNFRSKAAENGATYIQLRAPDTLHPGKGPPVPTGLEAVWAPGQYWMLWWGEKYLPFVGNELRFFSHLSHSQ
jgi:hypothetical protein